MKTTRILLCIAFLCTQNVCGQTLTSLVNEASSIFEFTKKELKFPKTGGFLPFQHFYTQIDSAKNVNLWQSELKKIESSQYRKDFGLVFKANAHYNLRNGFDEETNNFNIGRIRAELEWNILKSGYTYNRTKAKRAENEMQILQYKSLQSGRVLMRRQFRIDYTYLINKESITFFERFLTFENQYFDYLNKLYFKKYIKREQLIKVSHQIGVLEAQIKTLKEQNEALHDSVSLSFQKEKSLPFLQLKIDSLSLKHQTRELELQKRNVELQHKAVNDLNFSFYAQESFNYFKTGHRIFPSVGIRFRAPIRFNHRKKIIETKKKILTAQSIDKSVGKYNRFITLTSGYNEKLKDVKNQHKSWEVVEERIRILSVLKAELNNAETGTLLLGLLEKEFKVLENMLQLKRQLYTTLSHVFELTEVEMLHDVIVPIRFEDFRTKKLFAIKRSDIYTIDFQIQFLKAKGCTEVQVLEKDFDIQKALFKANIQFKKVEKITYQFAEQFIQSELREIHKKS